MESTSRNNSKRYIVQAKVNGRGIPIYVVIDSATGNWEAVRDCQLWAEHKAKDLNKQAAGGREWVGKIRQK